MSTQKKEFWIITSIIVILMIIFAFYDLMITQAIFNPKSLYGMIFQIVGELPCSFTAVCSAMILLIYRDREVKWKNILTIVLCSLLILIGSSMGVILSSSYVGIHNPIIIILLMMIFIGLAFLLVRIIPKDKVNVAKKIAFMGIILFFLSLLIFNGIKMSWGRMRYVLMDNPSIQFTPWYIRQGFTSNDAFMSFPSGHAAQSSFMLMITLFPLLFERMKNKGTQLKIVSYIWIILVCISRVVMGKHFSSDVTMGFCVTFLLFILLKKFYLDKRLAKLKIDEC